MARKTFEALRKTSHLHLPKRLKLAIGQIVGQSQELALGDRVG